MTKDHQLYAVISLVRPVFRALVAAVEDRLAGSGLGVPGQFVLRTCNGLLQSGLVERRPNPLHARSALLALTPAGVQAFAAVRARETLASKPLAAALPAAGLVAAARVLQAMRDHYEQLPRLHG